VRGKVVKTGKPETPWLTLAGEKEEARIRCQLVPEASANPLPKTGSLVTVRGMGEGKRLGLSLKESRIVSVVAGD
ncbi:MAG: hypothetical protein LBU79_06775, partial [Planctomycetota bacterium]|jgi:hypothetical protein|nr:hypothetical protein [Planctomycetota bacterium]